MEIDIISPSVITTGLLLSSPSYGYALDMGQGSGSPWHLYAESLQLT